jgi:hypothetical protein
VAWFGDLLKAGINSNGIDVEIVQGVLKLRGRTYAPGTTSVRVLITDGSDKVLLATGTTVPSDGENGYAKGCLFIDTDVGAGTTGLYVNVGTTTSANFDAVSDA